MCLYLLQMVCVPQADEQQLLQVDNLPAVADGTSSAVAAAVAEEELTASCVVHDHTKHSAHSGPITIFVKSTSTVDDLYLQIATQLNLPEAEFDVSLKTEVNLSWICLII